MFRYQDELLEMRRRDEVMQILQDYGPHCDKTTAWYISVQGTLDRNTMRTLARYDVTYEHQQDMQIVVVPFGQTRRWALPILGVCAMGVLAKIAMLAFLLIHE